MIDDGFDRIVRVLGNQGDIFVVSPLGVIVDCVEDDGAVGNDAGDQAALDGNDDPGNIVGFAMTVQLLAKTVYLARAVTAPPSVAMSVRSSGQGPLCSRRSAARMVPS